MPDTTWDRDRIAAALRENAFSYQDVPLPHGLSTGGEDRSATAAAIFSDGMAGKSLFDLGCMYGFFCFSAEGQGATRCVGADIDPENVRKSRLLAEMKGSKAEFLRFDIETDAMPGTYDDVLCLNILHHLRNPISALQKLAAASRDRLVLELAGFASTDRRKNGVPVWLSWILGRLPVLYAARDSTQTFFITSALIEVLLLTQRFDFARIEKIRGGHKGREIVIAYRRKIGRLFVVAGMPAGGKSTLIAHLQSPAGRADAERLGFDPALNWRVVQFGDLAEDRTAGLGDVILHYNIPKHVVDGDIFQHERALSDLMSVAADVKVVTLMCPRARLRDAFKSERMDRKNTASLPRRGKKKFKKFTELFESQSGLADLYGDWYGFLVKTGNQGMTVFHDGGAYTIDERRDVGRL